MKLSLIIAVFLALTIGFMSYTVKGAPEEVKLTCLNVEGTEKVEYKGSSSDFDWYIGREYVEVKLHNKILYIPQHRCEYERSR